jgi:hypothetical protein
VLRVLCLITVFLGASRSVPAQKWTASYAEGKCFKIDIRDKELLKSPAWEPDSPNPPLAARKAIEVATEQQRKLVKDSKDHKWEFVAADLTPDPKVDRWYWTVIFQAFAKAGQRTDDSDELRLIILMDGRVLKPNVRAYRRR